MDGYPTSSIKCQVAGCLKWRTTVPSSGSSLESSPFWCQGFQMYFKFVINPRIKQSWYFLYIVSEKGFEPFEITCYIDGNEEPIHFGRAIVENESSILSSYHADDLKAVMNRLKSKYISFVFLFPDDADLKLPQDSWRTTNQLDYRALQNLSADMAKLLNDESSYDAIIECQGKSFYVHTDILCARSKEFAELLGGWNYLGGRRTPGTFKVDMDKKSFLDILSFIYTGKIADVLDQDTAKRLFKHSRGYSLYCMTKIISDFLVENLTQDTVFDVLFLAIEEKDEDLKERVIQYMFERNVLDTEEWIGFRDQHCQVAIQIYHKFYLAHRNF